MTNIRLGFGYEEFYPVYILTEEPSAASEDIVDIDTKLYKRYKRVMKAFDELQNELGEIDPLAKRIKH